MQIKNTKNSVKPLLEVYRNRSRSEQFLGYQITNQGLGPALIFDMFFLRKGAKIRTDSLTDYAIEVKMPFWKEGRRFYQAKIDHEDALRVGDSWWILKIDTANIDKANFDQFLDDLNLIVRYRSLTDDTFTAYFSRDNVPKEYQYLLKR